MARPLSIRTRVVLGSLAVLIPATLLVEAGGWWLMRHNLIAAADSYLLGRVDGVRAFIDHMAGEAPYEGLEEELQEYVRLTAGDALLEVVDGRGRVIAGPLALAAGHATAERLVQMARTAGEPKFAAETIDGRSFRFVSANITAGGQRYAVVAALPVGQSAAALARFAWTLVLATPLVLAFAAAAVYVAVRRSLTPVDRIAAVVRAITVRDLDRRLDVPAADDELRRLTQTFNAMLARLQAAVANLTRFTGDAAHELRTPVTLVRTTVDVALSRERSAEEYRQALAEIVIHAGEMSTLVDDLLVLARADAGVEARDDDRVDVAALATRVVAGRAAEFGDRSLELDVQTPATPAVITGRGRDISRVLDILLDNALRYTPAGRVSVRVSTGADGVELAVTDTGIGIPAAEHARVFDRFFRGEQARQRSPEGAGLGLSIARALVERHGGRISVSAGDTVHGTRVVVSFPAAA